MSLLSLSNFDAITASAILANAALQAGSSDEASRLDIGGRKYADETARVMAEIRSVLGISDADQSVAAWRKIDTYIANALDDLLRPADGGASALDRAGLAGRLPPSLFRVMVDKRFDKTFGKFGFGKKVVERIIHGSDDIQHLLPELKAPNSFSLFIKRETVRGVKNSEHWAIVHTARGGRDLFACSAWRVFDTDVDLSKAEKPLDVLRAFVEKYGVIVKFGSQRAKLVYQEHTFSDPLTGKFDVSFEIENQPKDSFTQAVGGNTNTPGLVTHGPFYCIDMAEYKIDMRGHGFRDV